MIVPLYPMIHENIQDLHVCWCPIKSHHISLVILVVIKPIFIPLYTWWFIPLSKWVITPVINGISRVNPLIIGVIIHLLSGMSQQVWIPLKLCIYIYISLQYCTWRFPKMGAPPNHPTLDDLGIETHGFLSYPIPRNPQIYIYILIYIYSYIYINIYIYLIIYMY